METVANNFLPFENEMFMSGIVVSFVVSLFLSLLDLVYAHIRHLERRRAEMRCSIFLKGYGEGPCYNKLCPANRICRFYEKPHWPMAERIRHWIDMKRSGTR